MFYKIHIVRVGFAALAALGVVVHAQSLTTTQVNKNAARDLAANCAGCHGTNGKSVAEVQSLAGQTAAEISQKMKDFREGKTSATIMHQLAKGYSDAQVALIADYFSKQAK